MWFLNLCAVIALLGAYAYSTEAVASANAAGARPSPRQLPAVATPAAEVDQARGVFDRYCVTCHNQRTRAGQLSLQGGDAADPVANPELWEKVVRKLRARSMPPAGMPRPEDATRVALVAAIEGALDRAAALKPDPGRPASVHRLNRAEYMNAVRDLLGIEVAEIDPDGGPMLPADDATHGFDNVADALSFSPALLDRYLAASKKISRAVIGDTSISPGETTYRTSRQLSQDQYLTEELPFGSHGGLSVRYFFPVDGVYAFRIRLQRNSYDYIIGMLQRAELQVRIDGQRVGQFVVGGERRGKPSVPSSDNFSLDGDPVQEEYERISGDAGLEVRLAVKAGSRAIGVTFVGRTTAREGLDLVRSAGFGESVDKSGAPRVGSVTISGPFEVTGRGMTAARQRIFVCRPARPADEQACARQILSGLARQAYRRVPTAAETDTLLRFFALGRRDGDFEAGIQAALERLLVDPAFLTRVEVDPAGVPPGTAYRLTDVELASRLSFFLWSSIPDEPLLNDAVRGRLSDPAVLRGHVRRMLADRRSAALVNNFAGQWLYVRNVQFHTPNPDLFVEFDDNLRNAFRRETELFFSHIMKEDRSILELFTADYTFLNERLARHYGVPGVYGPQFRLVKLPAELGRGGLLGQGSLLMTTSYPNRTSPVLRGKWLLENVLGAPPPPPPPNVPALPESNENGERLTVRQRLERHRRNPVCAACHSAMDPWGFALENFNAVGAWRETEDGVPVEASATLPDGSTLEGLGGLRQQLEGRREEVAHAVTERLLTFALGRGVDLRDGPAIRQITRTAARDSYQWSSLVTAIVESAPFQMRRSGS